MIEEMPHPSTASSRNSFHSPGNQDSTTRDWAPRRSSVSASARLAQEVIDEICSTLTPSPSVPSSRGTPDPPWRAERDAWFDSDAMEEVKTHCESSLKSALEVKSNIMRLSSGINDQLVLCAADPGGGAEIRKVSRSSSTVSAQDARGLSRQPSAASGGAWTTAWCEPGVSLLEAWRVAGGAAQCRPQRRSSDLEGSCASSAESLSRLGMARPEALKLYMNEAITEVATPLPTPSALGGEVGTTPGQRLGLKLQVPGEDGDSNQSTVKMGQWHSDGRFEEQEEPAGPLEIPTNLQPIDELDVTLVAELGRGQFGTVWLGRWLGIHVALKQIHDLQGVSCQELVQEAEMLASLRHPCVVAFYGMVAGESPMTALEFMPGGSLKSAMQQLKAKTEVSAQARVQMALRVARGMEYLHSRKVVHFDLKAENLLCDLRHLEEPVIKIADMGLSKTKLTTFISGNMRGTVPWMAPELFFGSSEEPGPVEAQEGPMVTEKVDVFSFGVVMWEIWQLGETPYNHLNMSQIFNGVMSDTLRPSVPDDCHPLWTSLMTSCWTSRPSKRPDFPEIAHQLEGILRKLEHL